MKKAKIVYLVAVLFLASAFLLTGCAKKVSEVKEDTLAAEAAKKEAEARQREAARLEEEKKGLRESIVTAEKEVPPQAARGKEFGPADVLKMVFFEFDKSSLTEEAKATLKQNAEWLRTNPNAEALIEGHCDERGTDEYNLALGERRALSARKYLISLGIDPVRLYTISYGEEKPLDPGHNEEAWAKNRRVQFQISRVPTR